MNWTWFLFGFKGRINRAKLWLAGLIIIGWMLFVAWMLYLSLLWLAGDQLRGQPLSIDFGLDEVFAILDPASYHAWSRVDLISVVAHAIGTPVWLWIYLATSIKRLHDRDRSGWWMVPFFVIPGLISRFADRLGDSIAVTVLGSLAAILLLWGFIELYCLRGTPWTNRFGPNPLPKTQNRPRSTHATSRGMLS